MGEEQFPTTFQETYKQNFQFEEFASQLRSIYKACSYSMSERTFKSKDFDFHFFSNYRTRLSFRIYHNESNMYLGIKFTNMEKPPE